MERTVPPAPRNFTTDFLLPALDGLTREQMRRVAVALDTAVLYGALEHAHGNDPLTDLRTIESRYWDNVQRLRTGDL